MSSFWEALFEDKKQDWLSCVIDSLSGVSRLLWELPSTMLAFLMASVDEVNIFGQSTAEFLQLSDWWCIEHSFFLYFIIVHVPLLAKKTRFKWLEFITQLCTQLSIFSALACFLWTVTGLQGGELFGGLLLHPTVYIWGLTSFQMGLLLVHIHKEIYGHVAKRTTDKRAVDVMDISSKFFFFQAMASQIVATFGLPNFYSDNHSLSWLSVVPMCGIVKVTNDYLKAEALELASRNGVLPQVKAEGVKESEGNVAEKIDSDPKGEDSVQDEDKTLKHPDKGTKDGEKKSQPSDCPLKSDANSMLECVRSWHWDRMLSVSSLVLSQAAMAYAEWHLTEDMTVFLMAFLFVMLCMLDHVSGTACLLTKQISMLVHSALRYYIVRTYVRLPN